MNKSILWIIIVVILLVVLGVIFLGGGNKGEENNTNSTSTVSGDNNPPQDSTSTTSKNNLDNLPLATGNVSDITAALLSEATGVNSLPDQTDPSLTQIGTEVNNFDQSSNVQF